MFHPNPVSQTSCPVRFPHQDEVGIVSLLDHWKRNHDFKIVHTILPWRFDTFTCKEEQLHALGD